MDVDTRDLPLSADPAAGALYRDATRLMLSAWPGADVLLEEAVRQDPGFALAQVALARLDGMAGRPASARERLETARGLAAARGTDRERSHVHVVTLAMSGQTQAALSAALEHADRWPRDVVILSLPMGAFGLFAFSGMADHDAARVALCRRHAARFADDDWWFLTTYGWALAEDGEVAEGRRLVERAFGLRRENANTVHAYAHALFEAGAGAEAEALIANWLPTYDRRGILHGHLSWHHALIALERGDADTALAIYRDAIQPSVSHGMAINVMSDAAALLWRAELYGHAVPAGLWSEAADLARPIFPRPGHAFVDTHMAMIEAATGAVAAAEQRIAGLDELVTAGSLGAGAVVPAMARAFLALASGDASGCADILEPVASEVVRIGGSGAQREIVEDTRIAALMRAGRLLEARQLIERRLARRPSPRDSRWLAACPAGQAVASSSAG